VKGGKEMLRYIIKGGKKLEGEVKISGSKNASLPILAASILNTGKTTLYNVPDIHDTQMMFEILKNLGGKVEKKNNKIVIDTSKINNFEIPEQLMRQMRSSVILAGSLLGKYKKAIFSYPGGCDIGSRPIDLHLKGFEKLGINITKNYGNISCICDKIIGEKIDLDFPSVGATENIMLASCLGEGTTLITNAAMEPEIIDLQNFLNKMGAKINGAGSSQIQIEGVKKLRDVSYNVMPDRIEAGTFLCATVATEGNVKLKNLNPEHITPIINKLEEIGCKIKVGKTAIELLAPKRIKATDIKTMPYPGFPTDMQSIFASMLTTAKGTSIVIENIFENRYKYIQELNRMGAKISIEGKTAIIKGVRKLYGTTVNATDLRGGAAMVIAGLMAKGTTNIENIGYILRGYEKLENKLTSLNADIKIEKI
jgi:UDP-N-acetylglucosamine 1-carboxyvinyltransferase